MIHVGLLKLWGKTNEEQRNDNENTKENFILRKNFIFLLTKMFLKDLIDSFCFIK